MGSPLKPCHRLRIPAHPLGSSRPVPLSSCPSLRSPSPYLIPILVYNPIVFVNTLMFRVALGLTHLSRMQELARIA